MQQNLQQVASCTCAYLGLFRKFKHSERESELTTHAICHFGCTHGPPISKSHPNMTSAKGHAIGQEITSNPSRTKSFKLISKYALDIWSILAHRILTHRPRAKLRTTMRFSGNSKPRVSKALIQFLYVSSPEAAHSSASAPARGSKNNHNAQSEVTMLLSLTCQIHT